MDEILVGALGPTPPELGIGDTFVSLRALLTLGESDSSEVTRGLQLRDALELKGRPSPHGRGRFIE